MSVPIDLLLESPVFAAIQPGDTFVRACDTCLDVLVQRFPVYRNFLAHRGFATN